MKTIGKNVLFIIIACLLLISCNLKEKPENFDDGKYIYDETIINDVRFRVYSHVSNFFSGDDIIVFMEYEYIGDSDSITFTNSREMILSIVIDEEKNEVLSQGTDGNEQTTTLKKNQIYKLILTKGATIVYDDMIELDTLKTFKLDKGTYKLRSMMSFGMEDKLYDLECLLAFSVGD